MGSNAARASIPVAVLPAKVFAVIERLSGRAGRHFADWLWTLRGWLDLRAGGWGMRRGRRDADQLQPGDVVDCWRVEAVEQGRRLRTPDFRGAQAVRLRNRKLTKARKQRANLSWLAEEMRVFQTNGPEANRFGWREGGGVNR